MKHTALSRRLFIQLGAAAGGITPWGTWLTCEETTQAPTPTYQSGSTGTSSR